MIEKRKIDDIDRKILDFLQENSRVANAEIARRVGMAPSAIAERIRKLEESEVVRGYAADLDPRALGRGLLGFVFVQVDEPLGCDDTAAALAAIPEAQEVHHIAGEDCYLVKVRTADTEALRRLLREEFGAIEAVRSTRTTIVLETVKETGRLPLSTEANGDDDPGPVAASTVAAGIDVEEGK